MYIRNFGALQRRSVTNRTGRSPAKQKQATKHVSNSNCPASVHAQLA